MQSSLARLGGIAIAVFAWSVMHRMAFAESVSITAMKDASLYASNPSNSSGGGPGIYSGGNGSGSPRRGLIAFDIAANVPNGAAISSVELSMYLGQAPNTNGATIALRRMLANWGEGTAGSSSTTINGTGNGFVASIGDATWNDRFSPSIPWAVADVSTVTSAAAVVTGPIDTGFVWNSTSALISDVQGWLDTPLTNFGWLIMNSGESIPQSVKAFYSRSAVQNSVSAALDRSWRPMLTVTYVNAMKLDGDYNGNGVVDAADYVLWRETLGQPVTTIGSGADGDQSGAIEPGDYMYWRERFTNIGVSGAGEQVPEPAQAVLWLLAVVLACSQRRR
jgi:hypothetical protein